MVPRCRNRWAHLCTLAQNHPSQRHADQPGHDHPARPRQRFGRRKHHAIGSRRWLSRSADPARRRPRCHGPRVGPDTARRGRSTGDDDSGRAGRDRCVGHPAQRDHATSGGEPFVQRAVVEPSALGHRPIGRARELGSMGPPPAVRAATRSAVQAALRSAISTAQGRPATAPVAGT
jgi:hypothetical protein